MSDKIKPGDLVMIVKPCLSCGKSRMLGFPYTVEQVRKDNIRCGFCGFTKVDMAAFAYGHGVQLQRLKKIDPPSEGDSLPTRADKEITA